MRKGMLAVAGTLLVLATASGALLAGASSQPAMPNAAAAKATTQQMVLDDFGLPISQLHFPAGQTHIRLKLQRGWGWNLLTHDITVNGKDVGYFIIDTGAGSIGTNLRRTVADELRLPRRDGGRSWQDDPADDGSRRRIASLSLGGITITNMPCGARNNDMYAGYDVPIAGSIGCDVLAKLPFTLDYNDDTLIFYEPSQFKPPEDAGEYDLTVFRPGINSDAGKGTSLDLEDVHRAMQLAWQSADLRANPNAGLPMVWGSIDRQSCNFVLDTGTPIAVTVLPPLAQRRPSLLTLVPADVTAAFMRNWDSVTAHVSSCQILGHVWIDPLAVAMVSNGSAPASEADLPDGVDALAGARVMENYRLTFDYTLGKVWAKYQRPPGIEQQLKNGMDANAADLHGWTPLMVAAMRDDALGVKTLLAADANINAITGTGYTALHAAAEYGAVHASGSLLNDPKMTVGLVNAVDAKGITPLMEAADSAAAAEIMAQLLDAGADITAHDRDGTDALQRCALAGNTAAVRLLVERKADLERGNNNGVTALMRAAYSGSVECYDALRIAGARANVLTRDRYNVLHIAAQSGSAEMVRHLLDEFPVDTRTVDGATPLILAASRMRSDAVQALLDAGADVNAATDGGDTALYAAALNRDASIVELLLKRGAKVDVRRKDGSTPLMAAVVRGQASVARTLIEHHASINARNDDGDTPFFLAARSGSGTLLKLLLSAGVSVNATINGDSALMFAADSGSAPAVQTLLDAKADVMLSNRQGATALHFASQRGDENVISLLLAAGADVNAVAQSQHLARPLHTACTYRRIRAVRLLLAAGADPDAKLDDGQTPLSIAIAAGEPIVEKMIREAPRKTTAPAGK